MEEVLTNTHGMTVVVGLIVMLALNLFKEIGKFAWDLAKKRNEVTAEKIKELTDAVSELTTAIQEIITIKRWPTSTQSRADSGLKTSGYFFV